MLLAIRSRHDNNLIIFSHQLYGIRDTTQSRATSSILSLKIMIILKNQRPIIKPKVFSSA